MEVLTIEVETGRAGIVSPSAEDSTGAVVARARSLLFESLLRVLRAVITNATTRPK